MNTTLPSLLFTMILAGCAVRENRCSRHVEEIPEIAPQFEQNNIHPLEEPRDDDVFPNVTTTYRQFNLGVVESFCKQRGIRAVGKNRVRLFVQPMGVVANAFEIDLVDQTLTVYPGTHGEDELFVIPLDEEDIARVRRLVTSPEFSEIPSENQKIGRDGTSYMLEASIDDEYRWVLHWSPDDDIVVRIIEQIRDMARNRNTEPEAGGYRR